MSVLEQNTFTIFEASVGGKERLGDMDACRVEPLVGTRTEGSFGYVRRIDKVYGYYLYGGTGVHVLSIEQLLALLLIQSTVIL